MGSLTTSQETILIIGGGLGGLCLAQGLLKANIPFHIYERDPTASWRPQGYRLRINGEAAAALQQNLPTHLWTRFQTTCATVELGETDINAIDASISACRAGGGPALRGMLPYTCDRKVLRDILLTGLEAHMSYGKEFVRYTQGDGLVTAHFADGSAASGSLLVGADGNRSPVRKQHLPAHKPLDTDGCCVYGKTPITAELLERFPRAAMRWMTLVTDRTPMTQTLDVDETPVTLLLEPMRFRRDHGFAADLPADYMYWVLIAKKAAFGLPDEQGDRLNMSGEEAAGLALKVTECWDPSIRALLHLQDRRQSALCRVLSARPDIAAWEPSSSVTLVGDAIHAMSPCGGVGAVTALMDAGALASAIIEKGVSRESIGEYEAKMRKYAGVSIKRSYNGARKLFGQQPFELCKEFEV